MTALENWKRIATEITTIQHHQRLEIERLRAQNAQLRETLQTIADMRYIANQTAVASQMAYATLTAIELEEEARVLEAIAAPQDAAEGKT